MYNNEQEKSTQSWKKPTDSLGHSAQPANDTTEISEEALENITGGVGPTPHPTIPNAYSYPSKGLQIQMPTATLITNNPSLPLHAEVMGRQYNGTVWQHAAFLRPDGQVEHHYDQIDTGAQPPQPPRKRQRIG